MSKKIKQVFLLVACLLMGLFVLGEVNAAVTITAVDGAQIRITGNQGLRFEASVDELPNDSTHGFYVAIGENTKEEIVSAIEGEQELVNGHKLIKKIDDTTDTTFSLVIYNIPASAYTQDITSIAFVHTSEGYTFPDVAITRNIAEVAKASYEDNTANEFINEIYYSVYGVTVKFSTLFTYSSLDEICMDFLNDYNAYKGTTLTKETLSSMDSANLYSFINDDTYGPKWNWLFDFIVTTREEQSNTIESYATSNYSGYITNQNVNLYTPYMREIVNNKYTGTSSTPKIGFVKEIYSLFNKTKENYYNFQTYIWDTDDATNIINSLFYTTKNIEIGDTITYKPLKSGYDFEGWYTSEDGGVTLDTKVTNPATDMVLYPNFVETLFSDSQVQAMNLLDTSNNDILYVSSLFSLPEEEYFVNGAYNTQGTNCFETINAALNEADDNDIIYVINGNYDEDITINKNNVTIYGPNYNKDVSDDRIEEANLTGDITLGSELVNTTIKGLEFSSASTVRNTLGSTGTAAATATNLNGFYFQNNNVVSDLSAKAFMLFIEADSSYSHDINLLNNTFMFTDGESINNMVVLDNLYNCNISGNKFSNIGGMALYVDDTTKGFSGENDVIDENQFYNIKCDAIHIDWLSPLLNDSNVIDGTAQISVSKNVFQNIDGTAIFLGKMNNDDAYSYIKVNNNYFNEYRNGIELQRVTEDDNYQSTGNVFDTVAYDQYYINDQTATTNATLNVTDNYYNNCVQIRAYDEYGSDAFSDGISCGVFQKLEIRSDSELEMVEVGQSLQLYAVSSDIANPTVTWSSEDENIATVSSEGLVTALSSGEVLIDISQDGKIVSKKLLYSYENKGEALLEFLSNNTFSSLSEKSVTYYGGDNVESDIYGVACRYYPGDVTINSLTYMIDTTERTNFGGTNKVEFITIHDVGSNSSAEAISNWGCHTATSSWHYTVGDETIYQLLGEDLIAWHAGDGSSYKDYVDTGVTATGVGRAMVAIDSEGYFTFNGTQSTVLATNYLAGAETSDIAKTGLVTKIGSNGNYYISPWYSSSYDDIGSHVGGQSLGLETCITTGTNIYDTWQNAAKLTSDKLLDYDLTYDRVVSHNNASGKDCPGTAFINGMYEELMDMIYCQYIVDKYFSDCTVSYSSSDTSILDNNGRVVNTNLTTDEAINFTINVEENSNSYSKTTDILITQAN